MELEVDFKIYSLVFLLNYVFFEDRDIVNVLCVFVKIYMYIKIYIYRGI